MSATRLSDVTTAARTVNRDAAFIDSPSGAAGVQPPGGGLRVIIVSSYYVFVEDGKESRVRDSCSRLRSLLFTALARLRVCPFLRARPSSAACFRSLSQSFELFRIREKYSSDGGRFGTRLKQGIALVSSSLRRQS